MDCCKAISMAAVYKGDLWADFWVRPGVVDFEPIPLGVIMTASGTGSECSGGAVITHEDLKVKTGRDYPKCNAKFALMDLAYTLNVSTFQMVFGGFDTLSHIMEIYFSAPDEENVSDDLAEALAGFIREIGLPTTLRELWVTKKTPMEEIAASVPLAPGSYGKLTHEDVLSIFRERLR